MADFTHKRKKDKGEAPHTWTYWDWPQLQLPGAAGLICWQGLQRLHCGLHHWESACAQHAGSWGMMEEWEIRVSAPGWQEVGLSEPLAVVLLGPESARKRDEKCFKKKRGKEKQTGKHNKKCHMRANMGFKWLSLPIMPRKKKNKFWQSELQLWDWYQHGIYLVLIHKF